MGKASISTFQKQCRRYLSSLSARQCRYLYVNVPGLEDKLILSNASPDTLMTYSALPMVSVHCLSFKDDFLVNFKSLFNLTDVSECYLIRTEYITKAFKDHPLESALIQIESGGDLHILAGGKKINIVFHDEEDMEEEDETQDDKSLNELERLLVDDGWDTEVKRAVFSSGEIAGVPLRDPHVLNELYTLVMQMESDLSDIQSGSIQYKEYGLELFSGLDKYHSNWYVTDRIPVKEDITQRLVLKDGIDVPSVKEYLTKKESKKDTPGEYRFYVYTNKTGKTVKCLSRHEDPDITIISTRPYLETVVYTHPKQATQQST